MYFSSKSKKIALSSVFLLLAFNSPTFAAIDVSAATTSITTDGTTAITAIGSALIGLAGIAVVFKWAKGAIFG